MNRTRLMPTKKRSWFYSPVVAVLLLLCVGWGTYSAAKAYGKSREARDLRDQYARDSDQLVIKQNDLAKKIDMLSTDRGMEAEVRNRYRVVKPGEQLVVVVDNQDASSAQTVQAKSFFEKLREFVGL